MSPAAKHRRRSFLVVRGSKVIREEHLKDQKDIGWANKHHQKGNPNADGRSPTEYRNCNTERRQCPTQQLARKWIIRIWTICNRNPAANGRQRERYGQPGCRV